MRPAAATFFSNAALHSKSLLTTGLELLVTDSNLVLSTSTGVANRSDAKSHISFCVSAKNHIIHRE